jgi:4-hydroxy-tetrahydrodipicolinate synthase
MPHVEIPMGVIPALVTPFDVRGEIDVEALDRLVLHLVDGGAAALFTFGSTGEYFSLTDPQKQRIAQRVVTRTNKSVPVLGGASSNSVTTTRANIRVLREWGIDGAVVLPPSWPPYSQSQILRFYSEVAAGSPLPIIAYNIPEDTGVNIEIPTVRELSRIENIVALKDTAGDIGRFMSLLLEFRNSNSFRLYQGDEALLAPSLLFGASGMISSLANVAPALFAELYHACRARDLDKVQALQGRIASLSRLFTSVGHAFFLGIKLALEEIGICKRFASQLNEETTDAARASVRGILKESGILI